LRRRAKRYCLAVSGEICAVCCGEQREVTLACPLECVYLREARKHEEPLQIPAAAISDPDVEVTEDFIRGHEELLLFAVYSLIQAALRTPGAADIDVLEALSALVHTRRTAESGLFYVTRAQNRVASAIQDKLADSMEQYEKEREGREHKLQDSNLDILRILVFLHRIGQQNLNGRVKGRMFIDMLRGMTPDTRVDERAPSIIL
jgi:hypothetical protein